MLPQLQKFLLLVLIFNILGCGSTVPDPELTQASQALKKMLSKRILSKSCFYIAYPAGTPSDYVQYFFSDLGVAEWPVALDELEAEQMQAAAQITLPANVTIAATHRSNLERKEIVMAADNANQTILLQAYLPQNSEPHFQEAIALEAVAPDFGLQELCESNINMGISPF